MSDKLGFTFYPKDWWTSESYFELTPIQRYYYLECLFIMYSNDGFMKTQKTQFENRTRTQVLQSDWDLVISKFILDNGQFTHPSVNKRLRKTVANRENGKKGGRPPKPKKPNLETQKNPPLESERERERENKDKENISALPKFSFYHSLIDYGAKDNLASDWLKVRKNKKATNTQTAFTKFINQVEKSGYSINDVLEKCIEKSWSGFEADWYKKQEKKNQPFIPLI